MLVNIGKCNSKEDLEKLNEKTKAQQVEEFKKNPPCEKKLVSTKDCKVTMTDNKTKYMFEDLVKCDYNDKDFIFFIKCDGTTRALRRDEIKEIYICKKDV